MFFPDRIKSILPEDKVLEIGPGATPFFRSDIFLELKYENDLERIAQSGNVGILKTDKEIIYYDGGKFPFEDKQFDYVICSHVLEHVPNADEFLKEIQRIGKKGYLEFPTVYYDYLYNFPEHQLFVFKKDGVINWMTKQESGLMNYSVIQEFFNKTCGLKYYETINTFKDYFFQGFEWFDSIHSKHVQDIALLTFLKEDINLKLNRLILDDDDAQKIYSRISFKKFLKFKLIKSFKRFKNRFLF